MARTKNNQRSASRVAVDVGATGTNPISKLTVILLVVSVVAAIWAVSMMTAPGRVGYYYFFIYAEYYMGVIALVSLSITIMVGLVATDRLVLSIRQRVMLQSTHRTTGLIAVSSLIVHVWTKVVEHHITIVDAFIPFLASYNRLLIGFGTLSGWIMILVMWTGIARARFIGQDRPWLWRSIHSISYLMWPIALVHGLAAGRAAKTYVNVSYVLCILMVLIGLAVRLSVSLNRRKDFASTMGTAGASGMRPVGSMVPTASAPAKRPGRRERAPEPETLGPVAVLDTWQPVAPPVAAPPMAEEPRGRRPIAGDEPMLAPRPRRPRDQEVYDERPRGGRRRADDDFEYDDQAPPARGRRYAEDGLEDTSARMRRLEDTSGRMRRPEMDDTQTRMRRVEMDDTSTRMRRVEMDDTRYEEVPEPRGRRYAEDEGPAPRSRRRPDEERYDTGQFEAGQFEAGQFEAGQFDTGQFGAVQAGDGPRGRRRADDDYDEIPRQRGSHYAADGRYGREEVDAPRARRDRGADDYDSADPDSGRHSRSQFIGLGPDDPNYLEPDETPTLIDMASRRARRQSEQQDAVLGQAGRGARRAGRGRSNDEATDDRYWARLRGEAN
jgi:hypothetical protein